MCKKKVRLFLLLGVFLALFTSTQLVLEHRYPLSPPVEDFKYLPSGTFLKGAMLSFDEVVSDYLWIQAIAYFGGHYRDDKQFPWLNQLIDTATTLDPCFNDPYEFGGVIFSSVFGDADRSTAIFEKGMENVPKHHKRYWYLPFFTAFNYMYYKKDYKKAADYLKQAASFPQRPQYLPLLVARLYANTQNPAVAIPFLEKMKESAPTDRVRAELDTRIKEIIVKKQLNILNNSKEIFILQQGREPTYASEMIEVGILREMPVEPFGGYYVMDYDAEQFRTTSLVDDMELLGKFKENPESDDSKGISFPFQ